MPAADPDLDSDGRHAAVALLCELIRRPSVTPADEGCQDILARRLTAAGFACESMQFGAVTNLWARIGSTNPLLCFAGHTDVVPAGKTDDWTSDPFEPVLADGMIYGRGAADMKGGLAAMVVAAEEFLRSHDDFGGSLAFLLTSDEEGAAQNGTRKVIETLQQRGENLDWCVIGEPSSNERPGDVVRVGRRGSLSGDLVIRGTQGHVAYPHLADNPIHRMATVLAELQTTNWDEGNRHFPPTSFQAVAVQSGVGAANVTPSEARTSFNFRYSTEWNHQTLQVAAEAVIESHATDYELEWRLSGEPFLTGNGELIRATVAAITEITGENPELSTGGGTSDGRFIAPAGADVVELGLVNATAHKANECTRVEHLGQLCELYQKVLEKLLLN